MYAPREKPLYSDRLPSRRWVPAQTPYTAQSARDRYASTSFVNERAAFNRVGNDESRAHKSGHPLASREVERHECIDSKFRDVPGNSHLQQQGRPPCDGYGRYPSWRSKQIANTTDTAPPHSIREPFQGSCPRTPRSTPSERVTHWRTPAQKYYPDRAAPPNRHTEVPQWNPRSTENPANSDRGDARRSSPDKYQSTGNGRERRPPAEGWDIRESTFSKLPCRPQRNPAHYIPSISWHQYLTNTSRNDRIHAAPSGVYAGTEHHAPVRAHPASNAPTDVRFSCGRDTYTRSKIASHYPREPWVPRHQTSASRHNYEANMAREPPVLCSADLDTRDLRFPRKNESYLYSNSFQNRSQTARTRQVAGPLEHNVNVTPSWNFRYYREAPDRKETPAPPVSATYIPAVTGREGGCRAPLRWSHPQHDMQLPHEQVRGYVHLNTYNRTSEREHLVHLTSHPTSVVGANSFALTVGSAAGPTRSAYTQPPGSCCAGAPAASSNSCAGASGAQVSPSGDGSAAHVRGHGGEHGRTATGEVSLRAADSMGLHNQQGTTKTPVDILTEILSIGPKPRGGVPTGSTRGYQQGVATALCDKPLCNTTATSPKSADGTRSLQKGGSGAPPPKRSFGACSLAGPRQSLATSRPSKTAKAGVTGCLAAAPKNRSPARILTPAARSPAEGSKGTNEHSSVAQITSIRANSFGNPLETHFEQFQRPKATKNITIRNDLFKPPIPRCDRSVRVRKTSAAAPAKAAGIAAAATSARKGSYVPRLVETQPSTKNFKGRPKPPPSPLSSSSSDSKRTGSPSSSSSSSDSSGTSSLVSSDSDSSSASPSYTSREAPSDIGADAGARRCSPTFRQQVRTQSSAPSIFKGPRCTSSQQKTSGTRNVPGSQKKTVSTSIQRPAVTRQAPKPEAALFGRSTPVIPRSTQAEVSQNSCSRSTEIEGRQLDGGRSTQEGPVSEAATNSVRDSSAKATSASATTESTKSDAGQAACCLSKEPSAVASVLINEESPRQQRSKIQFGSHDQPGPVSVMLKNVTEQLRPEILPRTSTLEERNLNCVPDAWVWYSAGRSVKDTNFLCKPAAGEVHPHDGGAAPPKGKEDGKTGLAADEVQPCSAASAPREVGKGWEQLTADKVQLLGAAAAPPTVHNNLSLAPKDYRTKQRSVMLPARRTAKNNSGDTRAPIVKVKETSGASSLRKGCTGLSESYVSEAAGVRQCHTPSSRVSVRVKVIVKAAASRKPEAGVDREPSTSEFAPALMTTGQPTAEHASAQLAATTPVYTGASLVPSTDEVVSTLSATTSAASPAFATRAPTVAPAPKQTPASPTSAATDNRDFAVCKLRRFDGPCACELTPVGLVNLGKTCSVNALLQALSATRVFSDFCNDVYHRPARIAAADAPATAVDPSEAKEVLTAPLTPKVNYGDTAPALPRCAGFPRGGSDTLEHFVARDKEEDPRTEHACVVNHKKNARCPSCRQERVTDATFEKLFSGTTEAEYHCIQKEQSGDARPGDLNLTRSLVAILYQMCNGTRLDSRPTGKSSDAGRDTSSEPAATDHQQEQQELQDARKQLRVFKQLRTKQWCEQRDEGIMNPSIFVRQVKLLNVEFQSETELDVEEIWRCIADRLLQEAGNECKRLALLLRGAGSDTKQRFAPEISSLGGNSKRPGTELLSLQTEGKSIKESGCGLTEQGSTSLDHPCCLKKTTEACMTRNLLSTLLSQGRGEANSSNADEPGLNSTVTRKSPPSTLLSKNHLGHEHGCVTDASSAVGAQRVGKIPAVSKAALQQTGSTTRSHSGPERGQDTECASGETRCIVEVDKNSHIMTPGPIPIGPSEKVSVNGQEGKDAGIASKCIQTHFGRPEQGKCRRLENGGQYPSEERTTCSEFPRTPLDISRLGRCVDRKVERNCQLAANAVHHVSSSMQSNPVDEQDQNCLADDGQKKQSSEDEIASSLRAAQALYLRLHQALTGQLMHVPVACGCCCPCSRVTVSGGKNSEPSVDLSRGSGEFPTPVPSLSKASFLPTSNSSTSNVDQLSKYYRITTANLDPQGDKSASELCGFLNEGGLRGGNERSDGKDTSSQGICEICNGDPARRASAAGDGDSHTKDGCVKERVGGAAGPLSSKKRSRRRILFTESDYEYEVCDRHSVAQLGAAKTTCSSVMTESPTVAEPDKALASEMRRASHPSEGQRVSKSPRNVTRTSGCNNPADTPNEAINSVVAPGSRNDIITQTQQGREKRCQRPQDAPLTCIATPTALHDFPLILSRENYVPISESQTVTFVPTAALNNTGNLLFAHDSAEILKSSEISTQSVASLSSQFAPPYPENKSVVPSSFAQTVQEELFSAALALRLPERSRWAASRSQGARNRLQARSAHGKHGPITLEECLNLALEYRCDGESALTAAQKTTARQRKGKNPAAEGRKAQQTGGRQRGPRARTDTTDHIKGLVLCGECGHFSCPSYNATGADATASTGSGLDFQNQESLLAKEAYRSRIEDFSPVNEEDRWLNCAAARVTQGEPAGGSDLSDKVPSYSESEKHLMCLYCGRIHTKTYFEQLPRLLVLQLQRSSPAEISARHASRAAARAFTGGGVKIKAHVQFPLELQEASLPRCTHLDQAVKFFPVHHRTRVATQIDGKRPCGKGVGGASYAASDLSASVSEGCCPPSMSYFSAPPLRSFALASRPCSQREASCVASTGRSVQRGADGREADISATIPRGKRVYKLRAVIEHQGRTGTSGHYVCFRRGFTCQSLKQTPVQESPLPVYGAPDFCTSVSALRNTSSPCQYALLESTANKEAAAGSASPIPDSAATSDPYIFNQACRRNPSSLLEPPCSEAVSPACVKLDKLKSDMLCEVVRAEHSEQRCIPTVRSAQEEKRNLETPHLVVSVSDLHACPPQIQSIGVRPSTNHKRLRNESQQLSVFSGENRLKVLASKASVHGSGTKGRKRLCTNSKRGSRPGKAVPYTTGSEVVEKPLLQSLASCSCADDEGLLGGRPGVAVGEKMARRRRKREASPAEKHFLEEEDWWEVNDSQATRTTWQHVSLCQAYLLVYELEEPVQVICEKRYLGAFLQAENLELVERKRNAPLTTAEEQTDKKVTEAGSDKGKTSTSRRSRRNRADKSTTPTVYTCRPGRGRKRAQSAPTNEERPTCTPDHVEPAKRQKRR